MNNRLKILCILLAAIYIYLIGYNIGAQIYTMVNGQEIAVPAKTNPTNKYHFRAVVNIKSKNIQDTSLKPIINKVTNEPVDMQIGKAKAVFNIYESSFPTWIWIAVVIQVVALLSVMFTVVYIPVLTFKIIKSVIRDLIFDAKNIKRIRRIGYATLYIFLGLNYYFWIDQLIAERYVSLSEYNIVSPDRKSIFLLFGIVILIFAEVLNISQKMKEEQDLTV